MTTPRPIPCAACQAPLNLKTAFGAWWPERGRRAYFCKDCLGEIVFQILPKVTDPGPTTPMGGPGGSGEPSPWQENAFRILEGG
jgi:hypothetical protein